MAEYTKASLQRLRESANMTRKVAAPLLGMSEDTLRRIEDFTSMDNKTKQPSSGDLARMEKIYNVPGLWYGYNHTNDDAFRDHLPELPEYTEQGAILSYFAESRDTMTMETEVLRDAADGKIDDPVRRSRLIKEVEDVAASALLLLQLLKGEP